MTRRNSLLALLTVIVVFNYVDRLALGLLLQEIKIDLALSDTQLGFLTGISFALFYAVMGIPIGRWADRGNRVTIIALTTAIWSAAVALCGAAANFVQLMLIRIGVAVGEAGCHPPALSLISDYFSRAERPRAVARYLLGWPIALVVGNVGAGWLNELYGWRATFVIIGLPGLLLAAFAAYILKETRGSAQDTTVAALPSSAAAESSLSEVFKTLWASHPYRHLLICQSLVSFFTYGILQWQPAFFVRSYGMQTGELGAWLALVYGAGGLLGTYAGGELAARYAVNNERLQLRAITLSFAVGATLMVGVYLVPTYHVAFAVLALYAVVSAATNGPLFATTQTLVAPRMRAMSVAIVLFFSNLIGMGLGPLATGALSDLLRPMFAEESLRYALVVFAPGYLWCGWHAWQASKTAQAVAAAQAQEDNSQAPPQETAARLEAVETAP